VAHIPAYRANPEVELTAIVDYDAVKAKRIKEQFGFKAAYDDVNEMLKKSDVDAVDICTPNYLHAPMAIAALRSGRDVLCEETDVAQRERRSRWSTRPTRTTASSWWR
jgi:predicted dehydrogenase